MSEPEEPTVFAPYEIAIDPAINGIDSVTVTREAEDYAVFDGKHAAPLAGHPDVSAAIRAELESWTAIEPIREAKISEIAAACRAEYTSTLITSYGAHFHADPEAILDVMNIISMLPEEAVYPDYKGADDVWRDLTREQFAQALEEGGFRKSACFAKRKLLTDQAEAATTGEELAAIVW